MVVVGYEYGTLAIEIYFIFYVPETHIMYFIWRC
jgi:hypothetical protein